MWLEQVARKSLKLLRFRVGNEIGLPPAFNSDLQKWSTPSIIVTQAGKEERRREREMRRGDTPSALETHW
jgi:hypothetical protein